MPLTYERIRRANKEQRESGTNGVGSGQLHVSESPLSISAFERFLRLFVPAILSMFQTIHPAVVKH